MAAKGRVLRGIGTAWCAAVFVIVMVGFFGIAFTQGFGAAVAVFSPFNFWNTGLILLFLAPGLALLALGERSS